MEEPTIENESEFILMSMTRFISGLRIYPSPVERYGFSQGGFRIEHGIGTGFTRPLTITGPEQVRMYLPAIMVEYEDGSPSDFFDAKGVCQIKIHTPFMLKFDEERLQEVFREIRHQKET